MVERDFLSLVLDRNAYEDRGARGINGQLLQRRADRRWRKVERPHAEIYRLRIPVKVATHSGQSCHPAERSDARLLSV